MISTVIVNWNTRDLLIDCITSIERTTPGCEIIVVDNASTDDSVQMVRERFPDVKLIASETNLGFGAGNNLGIAQATWKYVLLLNPDTIVKPGALEAMKDFLAANEDAGAVGCAIANPDGSPQESYWMTFPSSGWLLLKSCYLDRFFLRFRNRKRFDSTLHFPVAHLLGACIMAPRSLLQELGGFDESYFLYLEETDLCKRIIEAGKIIYHLPSATITHLGQQSSMQAAEWTNVEFYFSAYKFVRRHNPRWAVRYMLQCVIWLSAATRLLLWGVRLCLGSKKRKVAVKMLKGYWRLNRAVWRFEAYYKNGLSASGQMLNGKTILDSKQSLG